MKQLFIIFLGVLFLLGITSGCKKKSNSSTVTTTAAPYMTATIDDSDFSVLGATLAYCNMASSGGYTFLYIYGETTYGKMIKITLENNSGTGTTQFLTGNATAYYYPDGLVGAFTQAVSGSINLTSISPNLTGTFNFTCTDGTQIKNGSFSMLAP